MSRVVERGKRLLRVLVRSLCVFCACVWRAGCRQPPDECDPICPGADATRLAGLNAASPRYAKRSSIPTGT